MGYFFLLIALFAGAGKGYCGKKISGYTNGLSGSFLANIYRLLFCIAIGFVLILFTDGIGVLTQSADLICVSALSGVATAVFLVSWLICVRKSAYMMLDIFLMLGVLIPLVASRIFYDETITHTQRLGITLLLVAVWIMCAYNNSIKAKITPSAFFLLLLCGVSNGVADFSQKLFTRAIPNGSTAAFNFYTYVFAALVLIAVFMFLPKQKDPAGKPNIRKILGYVPVMALLLFANSYFKTLAAGELSAVLLYPLNQGCALLLSAVMAAVLFKEKLTAKAVIGMITAFISLLIINLL